MATVRMNPCLQFAAAILVLLLSDGVAAGGHGESHEKHHPVTTVEPTPLRFDFYDETCPELGKIVEETVAFYSNLDDTTPAPLLRLFFHDCFVQGCDASVLLNSTPNAKGEKDADINFSIGNFFVIDDIKAKLEKVCPDTVSCADVLAATAVYSVKQAGGPLFPIEYGRRDGLVAYAQSPQTMLPAFSLNVSGLLENFANAGLDLTDLVALSGAHTIGQGHCSSIKDRLYPTVDPRYKHGLGQHLLLNCTDNGELKPPNFDPDVQYFMDTVTNVKFDNRYFKNLLNGLGVFTSDIALLNDVRTRALVKLYAKHQGIFFKQFGESLRRMGQNGVLTGTRGQVRKQCWVRNSHNQDPAFDPLSFNFTNS